MPSTNSIAPQQSLYKDLLNLDNKKNVQPTAQPTATNTRGNSVISELIKGEAATAEVPTPTKAVRKLKRRFWKDEEKVIKNTQA